MLPRIKVMAAHDFSGKDDDEDDDLVSGELNGQEGVGSDLQGNASLSGAGPGFSSQNLNNQQGACL